jgi:hypothetical protein
MQYLPLESRNLKANVPKAPAIHSTPGPPCVRHSLRPAGRAGDQFQRSTPRRAMLQRVAWLAAASPDASYSPALMGATVPSCTRPTCPHSAQDQDQKFAGPPAPRRAEQSRADSAGRVRAVASECRGAGAEQSRAERRGG